MSVSIHFLAGQGTPQDLNGLGLGFYGPGNFGASVKVGQYQDNTYITDPTGATQGAKANNVKYIDDAHGQLGTGDVHVLRDIPNNLAPLNVRLVSDVACQVQNASITAFDRTTTTTPPVGVLTKMAELIHPLTTMNPGAPTGSGSTSWSTPGGSGGLINGYTYDPPLALASSPGASGLGVGTNNASTQHDWFICCSQSPSNIGTKTANALFFQCEYL